MAKSNPQVKILNVRIDILTMSEALQAVEGFLGTAGQCQIATVNPEFIMAARQDPEFREILNQSQLNVADGYGLRLAVQYIALTKNIKNWLVKFFIGLKVAWWGISRNNIKLTIISELVTGTDLVPAVSRLATRLHKKLFLLGGFNNTPQLVAAKLRSLSSGLLVDFSTFEANDVVTRINSFKPDILFVALGAPRQEKWIYHNLQKLPSVKVAIGVGGAFDYMGGKIRRAPDSWLFAFEWLYRLIRQPRRLTRIWNAFPRFAWLVFRDKKNGS